MEGKAIRGLALLFGTHQKIVMDDDIREED